MTGLVPIAVGSDGPGRSPGPCSCPRTTPGRVCLLALGIWRAPLLILAYLYQTTLIALNRESVGVRSLVLAAIGIGPLVAVLPDRLRSARGGARPCSCSDSGLVVAGYGCLAREGRQPAWHHHLARPLVASLVMVPALPASCSASTCCSPWSAVR